MKPLIELLKRVTTSYIKDPASILNEVYNEPTGSNKVMIVEPVVLSAVISTTQIPAGSYVKITGTTYTLDLLGKAHDPSKPYARNSIVTTGGNIYVAETDIVAKAFAVADGWKLITTKTVGPVTVVAGSVVCVGKYHNCVTAAGWLVDDDSEIKKMEP